MKTVSSIASSLRQPSSTDRELAVAIHDFVRDQIPFGFTRLHDKADAAYTLTRGLGLCTPKTLLFCSLLREAGFVDAAVVTVPIAGEVLNHLGSFPSRLQHCFTEVTVDN